VALPPSDLRRPRLAVLANGNPVAGVIDAQVYTNNHRSADRFVMTVALSADTTASSFWSSTTDIQIDLQISIDGNTFSSILQGSVDVIEIDALTNVLHVEGRDLTAMLIESYTQETFANRTSSEIASILASRHNLQAVVTNTTTPVGRYYQNQHDRITLNQFSRAMTEWDLLVFLAQQEGFDVFVEGQALHFEPPAGPSGAIILTPTDLIGLRLERALSFARGMEVTVKSWNSRQQAAFTQTASTQGANGSSLMGDNSTQPQRYIFVKPNLTSDQAMRLAQRKLAELSRHERVVAFTMPGELSLTARSLVTLQGTGTEFDQTYFVDSIERSLHYQQGFIQRLRCKNMAPLSDTTTPADIVAATTG
jgi:phage protein D